MKIADLILESKVPDTVIYGISKGKKSAIIKALKNLQSMTPIFSYTVKDYKGDIGIYLKSGKNNDDFKDIIYKAVSNIDKWASVSE